MNALLHLIRTPNARIETLAFIFIFLTRFDVPAWLMLIFWFGTQLLSGYGSIGHTMVSEGGTAFFAHIGGFVAGMVLIKTMGTRETHWRRTDLRW